MNAVRWQCLAELGDRGLEASAVVLDNGRRDQEITIKVAQHPLGTRLGTIDADDTEMFGSYFLDAVVDRTTWFV